MMHRACRKVSFRHIGENAVDKIGEIASRLSMAYLTNLIAVATAYADATGLPHTSVSRQALGQSQKLTQILSGADLATRRYENAMLWFAENWPPDLAWPAGIPRPMAEAA